MPPLFIHVHCAHVVPFSCVYFYFFIHMVSCLRFHILIQSLILYVPR